MCINDWRLGRLIRSKITQGTFDAATTTPFAADNQRVGWMVNVAIIDTAVANAAFVNLNGVALKLLTYDHNDFQVSLTTHGDLPTYAFDVVIGGLPYEVTVVEWLMPEKYIQAALQEFNSKYNF